MIDGFLNINKPPGPSSHDIVRTLKQLLNKEYKHKIGHTGTLDPPASGVLVIGIGRGNRLAEYILMHPKEYTGIIKLGTGTDTLDSKGETTETKPVEKFEQNDLDTLAAEFTGRIIQVPPAVSALKKDGVKFYVKARRGDPVEPDPREALVYCLTLHKSSDDEIELKVKCASGFYVRSLARDVARKLGTVGHLDKLVRISVGGFRIEESITTKWIEENGIERTFEEKLLPLEFPLSLLLRIQLDDIESGLFTKGMIRIIDDETLPLNSHVAVFSKDRILGIGIIRLEDQMRILKPHKVLVD
jgi:tRNA pseudouridine55 synthase